MPNVAIDVMKNRLLMVAAVLWLGCAGGVAAEEVEPAAVPESAVEDARRSGVHTELGDMALSLARPDAALWLELEDGGRALGLFYPEREPPAEGAMMILADVGENAASGITGGLSRRLTELGWAVLSIGLPAPPQPLQRALEARPKVESPPPAEGEESSVMIDVMADTAKDTPEQAYRSRVRQSLEAGLAALAERGYDRPVLLGVGRASNHVVAASGELQSLRALIWVAPEFYPQDAAALTDAVTAGGSLEILELHATRGTAREEAQRRWADLRRAGVQGYERQSVVLQKPPSALDAPALSGRIDAWLRSR